MGEWLSRSWLFEIVNSGTQKIEESFTLIIPPQSYTIRERGRVSITKTFGNAFIDDYGSDNLEITIKGVSGTSKVFPTFETTGTSPGLSAGVVSSQRAARDNPVPTGYDGRSAFYKFRDSIMRYRDRDNYDKMELRVYDLYDLQAYKCSLLEFTLDRNQDKPLYYSYTISLFVYERSTSSSVSKAKPVSASKDPFSVLDALDSMSGWFDDVARVHQAVMNGVSSVNTAITLVRGRVNTFANKVRSIVESPLKIAKQLLQSTLTLASIPRDLYDKGKLTESEYANFVEVAQEMVRQVEGLYMFAIETTASQDRQETISYDDGIDASEEEQHRKELVEKFQFSGVRLYTVKANDTLQSIALKEIGDGTKWPYTAMLNYPNIFSNNDLVVGEDIWIPVVDSRNEYSSYVVSEDPLHDPYGSDIRIDSTGNMIIQSNDVALISGMSNVKQAIDTRLNTVAGSMIKQTAFGLIAQPGNAGTTQAVSYIKMGIVSSLYGDPRIYEIGGIDVTVTGGDINASMNISVVGYDKTIPVSVTF